jgi:1,2-diacylglycerol 3-alpha-glucosyltransferase
VRILMISDVYFPRINGVSTSIYTFRSEMGKLGHQVYLIVPSYPESFPDDEYTIRIDSRAVALDPEDRMMKYGEITKQIDSFRDLRFDLLHIQTPFVAHYAGVKLARELAVPAICTYHTLFEEYLYHYIPWLPKVFLRFCARKFSVSQCNQVAGVISPSSLIVNLLEGYGVKNRITTLPTGIDGSHFKMGDGARFRNKLAISADKKLLLNVSRIAFEKNISDILKMFQRVQSHMPDTLLVIAGEGPAKDSCIQQVKDMQLEEQVIFVGYLDRNPELIDGYKAADLFVFSSTTETQGLVLLEAMAAGTPLVSVAVMGTKDVLKDNVGVRITDGTIEDFAEKVIEVISNDQLQRALAESGIAYAAEWDSARLAEKMLDFYADVGDAWVQHVSPQMD